MTVVDCDPILAQANGRRNPAYSNDMIHLNSAGYRAVEDLDKVHAFDVHGLDHYLAAPQVHVPILRGLFGPVITKAEQQAAVAAYQASAEPPCVAALGGFKAAAARLIGMIESADDPQTLVKAGSQFLATAKEAVDACRNA